MNRTTLLLRGLQATAFCSAGLTLTGILAAPAASQTVDRSLDQAVPPGSETLEPDSLPSGTEAPASIVSPETDSAPDFIPTQREIAQATPVGPLETALTAQPPRADSRADRLLAYVEKEFTRPSSVPSAAAVPIRSQPVPSESLPLPLAPSKGQILLSQIKQKPIAEPIPIVTATPAAMTVSERAENSPALSPLSPAEKSAAVLSPVAPAETKDAEPTQTSASPTRSATEVVRESSPLPIRGSADRMDSTTPSTLPAAEPRPARMTTPPAIEDAQQIDPRQIPIVDPKNMPTIMISATSTEISDDLLLEATGAEITTSSQPTNPGETMLQDTDNRNTLPVSSQVSLPESLLSDRRFSSESPLHLTKL
ncbi:hypothetical protein BST81_19195 [Leptolyngbya sp. 'hensonii']|uniref:hypothetical protein n=1 Tax=Leptolyngbya sp. 'hensonii' TaxID=1922337 RepID=UPI00094F624A|nr:hypothetical protein [Leptolyngbya sp. 'hensonii']OLP16822.1 hypothetical protein BST81_19195 [Leptolyngbya sp. 'hensonii']